MVDGDGPGYRRITSKYPKAGKQLDAIVYLQKDMESDEAETVNLQALAPIHGFGKVVTKRFPAEIDGDEADIVQVFEREIAFKTELHFRRFQFDKIDGFWFLVGVESGEAAELPQKYAWNPADESANLTADSSTGGGGDTDDMVAAFVVHPRRFAQSELGKSFLKLDSVQASILETDLEMEDVERMMFAIERPTSDSSAPYWIYQLARTLPRERLLRHEFGNLPYEEVNFAGRSYFRLQRADRGVGDAQGRSKQRFVSTPINRASTAERLASFPDDFQPNANGHPDGSGSGKWQYLSSRRRDLNLDDADPKQLHWVESRKRYESPRGAKGNTYPAIGKSLDPGPYDPRFAVLRWTSSISGSVRIHGNFRKFSNAKSGNGVRVFILADGVEQFGEKLNLKDTVGHDFDFTVEVFEGSKVDFVVDPYGNSSWDSTNLVANIDSADGVVRDSIPNTRPDEMARPFDAGQPSDVAVLFPDDRTMVSAPEPAIQELLNSRFPNASLKAKLDNIGFEYDVAFAANLATHREVTSRLIDELASQSDFPAIEALADMSEHVETIVLKLDFSSDPMLTLSVNANSDPSAEALVEGIDEFMDGLEEIRHLIPPQIPKSSGDSTTLVANPVLPLLRQLFMAVKVQPSGRHIRATVAMPRGLADFVKNDADTVIAAMAGEESRVAAVDPGSAAIDEPGPAVDPAVTRPDETPAGDDKPSAVSAPFVIEPVGDDWEAASGRTAEEAGELVVDNNGGAYSLVSRESLPANFRMQIEGRIEFLEGSQKLHNTQIDILRALYIRFGSPDAKADILKSKGYQISHSHKMLLLRRKDDIVGRADVGNGTRIVSAIPTTDGLKVTLPDREPSPFKMVVTKKDDEITIDFNDRRVLEHTDRFYLSGEHPMAIGGYTSRLYLGKVTVTDLGGAKSPPGAPGGSTALTDARFSRDQLQPILLSSPIDCMTLSEDGRFLLTGHGASDSVSVIDVHQLSLVKRIDTPSPKAILSRGDQLIVANHGMGTLSVFNADGGWEKSKTINLADPNPEYLSAPRGKYYKGVVAVRSKGNGRDQLPIIMVNVARGRSVVFGSGRFSAATTDYTGKILVVQSRAGSPNRYIAGVYSFSSASQGRASRSLWEQTTSFPLLYQVGATPYWFGDRQVFGGTPLQALVEADLLLMPDRVADVCYLFGEDRVRCVGLDKDRTDLGSRPFSLPDGIRNVTEIGELHVAATIGEHLHLFLVNDRGELQTVRLEAFEIPDALSRTDRSARVSAAWKDLDDAAE